MSDFAFPEEEKVRHRHLAWKSASIPSEQEIDGIPSLARALFFCEGMKHLARIFDYKWVIVDSGTYALSFKAYDKEKKQGGYWNRYAGLTIGEVNAKIAAICASPSALFPYGEKATAQSMTGKDDSESLWIEIYSNSAPIGSGKTIWTLNGYVYFGISKEKVQKKKETPDRDNAAGVDFEYYF